MGMSRTRMDVLTADGSPLAVWIEGSGPAIVLVHGSMCDHTTFDPLTAELGRDFTVFALDRRGFGASPDCQREIASVLHSSGAAAAANSGRCL
jgi:pimeloyl-ACP methyl ester carboxylesterase